MVARPSSAHLTPISAGALGDDATDSAKRPGGRARGSTFTLDPPSSPTSPQEMSFSDGERSPYIPTDKERLSRITADTPGTLPQDLYDQTMSPWRAAARRRLVKNVEWESKVIARMQERVRTPWLDQYFVYTSSLGTHTFFMAALPLGYFFGHPAFARELIFILALGVYVSSFVKDYFCSPRPFAPPVTRLTIGTHHLEYGFPSTHSTNSASIALYIFNLVYHLYTAGSLSQGAFLAWSVGLVIYAFSIVFGRLYAAMHSFIDCAMGVFLGTAVWVLHWATQDILQSWVERGSWTVPVATVLLGLTMVHKHPQPVEDCPCFEDAIAFISVVMGTTLGWWHGLHYGIPENAYVRLMPGSAYANWADIGTWWFFAFTKLVVGILIIFAWRIAAKATFRSLLPPTFRLLALAFTLPHRRFYTPATDYSSVPSEKGLHPIPSVIDLPTHLELESESTESLMDNDGPVPGSRLVRRGPGAKRDAEESERFLVAMHEKRASGEGEREMEVVKHYDADVLTKVFVYCGIGLLAAEGLPVMFEVLGWGVN